MTWRLVIGTAACALHVGCGLPAQPGQERAEVIVWEAVYGAASAPPPIEWREDDCGGPLAGARYEGRCYAGLYLRNDRALVAWRGSFHASSYAHELLHAYQWSRRVEDWDHQRPEWSLVEDANAKLAAAGF